MSEPLLLMTPGPTRVPDRVLRAGARPMIHHRTPEFSSELAAAIEMLGPVFGTRSPVLPVHTTGRGATEAAICNLFSAGDEIIACCNGNWRVPTRFASCHASSTFPSVKLIATSRKRLSSIDLSKFPRTPCRSL